MPNNCKQPIRALHVVYNLDSGGIETWLVQILEKMDRNKVAIDVLTPYPNKGLLDDRILATGAKILRSTHYKNPFRFARDFNQLVKDNGPYDIIHSHVYALSGLILRLGDKAGIPVRIAHSRNTAPISVKSRGILKALAYKQMQRWIPKYMTHGIAVSDIAGEHLFKEAWENNPNCSILPSGVDLSPYHQEVDQRTIRNELNIPENALVIGHVGRFCEQKNHAFIIRVFSEVIKQEPTACLLLVGDGELKEHIHTAVKQAGLENQVCFPGARSDIARLMLGVMDVFLFPSKWEGLGRVILEAQAAGLPCVFSDCIPQEVDIIKPLIHRINLATPPEQWASVLLDVAHQPPPVSQKKALGQMQQSPMSIETNVKALVALYKQELKKTTERV